LNLAAPDLATMTHMKSDEEEVKSQVDGAKVNPNRRWVQENPIQMQQYLQTVLQQESCI
jgi:hypothetical protein